MSEIDLNKPLMPKAKAIWLIENTTLTFKQIANFTGLLDIEIEALADEDIGKGIVGMSPIDAGELVAEEITRCEADEKASLRMRTRNDLPQLQLRSKGPRYTPVSKRTDKPDAIAYILKQHPEITDAQIVKLVGTTKPTITAIRDRTHSSIPTLRPRHPAELGLCTYQELEAASHKGLRALGKDPEEENRRRLAEQEAEATARAEREEQEAAEQKSGFDFSNFLSGRG